MRGACGAFVADEALAGELVAADALLEFPHDASDPLDYLGALGPRGLSDDMLDWARTSTTELVQRNGAEWVWRHRVRLRMELAWISSL